MNLKRSTTLVLYSMFCVCDAISGINKREVEIKVPTLSEIVRNIFKYCYEDHRTIVINGNSDTSIIKSVGDIENFSVMLYNESSNLDYDPRLKTTKVDSFIVTIDKSVDELEEILQQFKLSMWWNVTIPYFVLSGSKNGCSDAHMALKTVWKMNILDCYFVCIDSDQNPHIYTFNPYSNRVPDQWEPVQEIIDGTHYMAIYNRHYKKEDVCEGFTLDRTKYLDKATVNIVSSSYKIKTYHVIIKEALRGVLNVSVSYDLDTCSLEWLIDRLLDARQKEIFDIAQCLQQITDLPDFASYPINSYSLYALSNNLNDLTITKKIPINFDLSIVLLISLTAVIIYMIIFHTNFSRSYLSAMLEFLRLWAGIPLSININSSSLRILFYLIFIFSIILQANFKAQSIKWLIISESSKDIVSLGNLYNNTYKKVLISYDIEINENLYSWSRYLHSDNIECMDGVLNDTSTVCIVDFMTLSHQLQMKNLSVETLRNLHLSKYSILYGPFAYVNRQDWPLKNRFNSRLMSLESYGIIDKIMANVTSRITSNSQASYFTTSFNSLSLESMSFAFYFWIIGMACSNVCFIFETLIVSKTLIIEYGLDEQVM